MFRIETSNDLKTLGSEEECTEEKLDLNLYTRNWPSATVIYNLTTFMLTICLLVYCGRDVNGVTNTLSVR